LCKCLQATGNGPEYYYDNNIDIKTTYVKYYNIGSARLIATSVIAMSCSVDILCNMEYFNFNNHADGNEKGWLSTAKTTQKRKCRSRQNLKIPLKALR
jgi:hypothetical protein